MRRDQSNWARLRNRIIGRLRRRTEDPVDDAVRFDKLDVQAPLEGQGDSLYLADASEAANQRAAFSQHISC